MDLQEKLIHSEAPISDIRNDFLGTQMLNNLEKYLHSELSNKKFVKADGHSVLYLGQHYESKSKKKDVPEYAPIPDPISAVL